MVSWLFAGAIEKAPSEYMGRRGSTPNTSLSKGEGEPVSDSRPEETEQIHSAPQIQDSNACCHQSISAGLKLVHCSQLTGYILPYSHPHGPQEVSEIHSGANSLSVQDTAIQTLYGNESSENAVC